MKKLIFNPFSEVSINSYKMEGVGAKHVNLSSIFNNLKIRSKSYYKSLLLYNLNDSKLKTNMILFIVEIKSFLNKLIFFY